MKNFREFVEQLRKENKMAIAKKQVSKNLDLAGLMNSLDGCPIYVEQVNDSDFAAVGNIFSTRELVCDNLGIAKDRLIPALTHAINNPKKVKCIDTGPVLENSTETIDLSRLPIPLHAEKDGGPYFSSAVVVAKDKELGYNLSFHRMMVIAKDRVVMRILTRHLDEFIKRAGGELDIAFFVGAPINVLLSASISSKLGQNELEYANALGDVETVKLSNGIEVPADCEFAFEGKITKEMHDEGPFIDLTETYDVVRKQRVMKVTKMHHRNNALWHVLLPGGLEHKVLMGMPREPTIFDEVNKVCKCKQVNITPGGCSWLHAVVAIEKKGENDGEKAIDAAFAGHKSLKHVVIVDNDIDVDNPLEVEWAIATRFQADKDLVVKENQKGSSLDPSADPNTLATSKMGLDATKPLKAHGKNFEKARWKKVNLKEYV
ncbi:UbiD family decarboxylase [Candidatus Micrarchaeota archaeon]|nr:UbiD family decarboxylase [Candidatus Micrarchaeota archaeon]MBU1166238.1 UbiD family decarboxylase [Candidatus Micrarchaeota archaeon]MBU1886805.1 UbiD family decarboxylase [Candidatus Micrarchaeota archaeon]